MNALRLLLIAESNNPEWTSVPLVSHNHASALAKLHHVTLVTHQINQPAIERHPVGYREVLFLKFPLIDRVLDWMFDHVFKGDFGSQALTLVRIPFYIAFERRAWRTLKTRLAAREFDVVMRLTPVSPAVPSYLAGRLRRLGIPFVIGPINGGLPWPKGFEQASRDREWLGRFRKLYRFLPYMRSTYRDASAILVGSSRTWDEQSSHAARVFFIPENGIHDAMVKPRASRPAHERLELIFVGRLVPLKACDLALEAAAPLILGGRANFTVVGDGRERVALEALVDRLGIGSGVRFTGELKHAQAMAEFERADVLVFPSVRDFGGGVVFEALAYGCVPVVADYGGPADIVTQDVGLKIALTDAARTRDDFTRALESLHADRARLAQMSAAGQVYAREQLSWTGKVRLTTQVLHWVSGQGPRPQLLPPQVTESA